MQWGLKTVSEFVLLALVLFVLLVVLLLAAILF